MFVDDPPVPSSVGRFEFLQPWHQYNPYYEFKKQFFLQKEGGDGAQVPVGRGGRAGPSEGSVLPSDSQPRYCPQAVSAPEEAPAESAPEKPSDPGEEGVAEDPADSGGRGGPGGKKELASGKAAPDGKLVKGTLLLAFLGFPALARRGSVPAARARLPRALAGWGCPVWPWPADEACAGPLTGLAARSAGQGPCRSFQVMSLGPQSLIDMQTLSQETRVLPGGLHSFTSVPFMFAKDFSSTRTDRRDSQCNKIKRRKADVGM